MCTWTCLQIYQGLSLHWYSWHWTTTSRQKVWSICRRQCLEYIEKQITFMSIKLIYFGSNSVQAKKHRFTVVVPQPKTSTHNSLQQESLDINWLTDVQLISTTCIITGILQLIHLPWLSVPNNNTPSQSRRDISISKLLKKVLAYPNWPSFNHLFRWSATHHT